MRRETRLMQCMQSFHSFIFVAETSLKHIFIYTLCTEWSLELFNSYCRYENNPFIFQAVIVVSAHSDWIYWRMWDGSNKTHKNNVGMIFSKKKLTFNQVTSHKCFVCVCAYKWVWVSMYDREHYEGDFKSLNGLCSVRQD